MNKPKQLAVVRPNDTEPNQYIVEPRESEHTFSIDPASPLFIAKVLPAIIEAAWTEAFLDALDAGESKQPPDGRRRRGK